MAKIDMQKMVSFCKKNGYIFQGSEIYGGLANTWDYGPLGTRLKNNIKDAWRKRFIQERKNAYEVDAAILMHPRVWEASGHVASFADPKMDCKHCKARLRADNLVEDFSHGTVAAANMSNEELYDYIVTNKVPCPKCGSSNFTEIKQFNLMFETYRGTVEGEKSIIYLRPENAQGEYTNYLNVLRSMRTKLPFSIGQIGKAFRNEITPGNFTFRTIEFEQMEYQTFCKPGEDLALYEYFKEYGRQFFMDLGLPAEKLRYHDHEKLAFYAAAACDIEYNFPVFGWGEINGTHDRTNHDLSAHQQYAGENMEYLDPVTNERYVPYIVESTYGVDRTVLAILMEAYDEETLEDSTTREVLKLNPALAPYKVAVLPLMKKTQGEKATELYQELSKHFMVTYDESGSIGKRYRRQDEIGTPFCVTVDFDTENDNCVTVRNRDTMTQERVNINDLVSYVEKYIKF